MDLALPANRQKIKDDLLADFITWSGASEKLQALPPSWQSKDWKVRRAEIIKDHCEKCGTKHGPFVIQHSKHPQKIQDIIASMADNYGLSMRDFVDKAKAKRVAEYVAIKEGARPSCPKCGSTSIRWHKTDQVWKCKGTAGLSYKARLSGRHCDHQFAIPMDVVAYSPESKRQISKLNSDAFKEAGAAWWEAACDQFGKAAVLENLRQSALYSSLEDTRTLCKRCAFIEDKYLVQRRNVDQAE